MSEFIGLLVGQRTRTVWRFIDPANDSELDDPRLLATGNPINEPVRLLRIPRKSWEASVRSGADVHFMVDLAIRLERNAHGPIATG